MFEDMNPEHIDLSSFKLQDTLHPKFWSKAKKLDPTIARRLIKIAKEFFEGLDLPHVQILDITFTGSLANFNWSNYSDVDLHIIVDYNEVDENEQIVREMFNAKKAIWNRQHDIRIFGFEVEMYVQNSREPHHSSGVYSIMRNDWETEPSKTRPEIEWDQIKIKAASIIDHIDRAKELYHSRDYENAMHTAKMIKGKIKNYRQAGLESDAGEYSVENLAFKVLRRLSYLGDLNDIKDGSYDALMSIRDEAGLPSFYEEHTEPFQKKVAAKHSRNRLTDKGKKRKTKPYNINPPKRRGKSAPPIGEEVEQLSESVVESSSNYWSAKWDWITK